MPTINPRTRPTAAVVIVCLVWLSALTGWLVRWHRQVDYLAERVDEATRMEAILSRAGRSPQLRRPPRLRMVRHRSS